MSKISNNNWVLFADEAWKYSLERDGMVPEVAHYPYNQNPDGPCLDTTVKDTRAEVTHSIRFSSENEDEMVGISYFNW